jgi:hypothetical protein
MDARVSRTDDTTGKLMVRIGRDISAARRASQPGGRALAG